MNSLHPLFLDYAWVAGTGPVQEFNAAITTALRIGLPALVVVGPSGAGKTSAAQDLFDALAADTKIVPWRASAIGIKKGSDFPRFFRSFESAPASGKKAIARLAVASDQERAFNEILLSCAELQTQRAMLFIDEAQELTYPLLVILKGQMDMLARKGVHLLVLLLAEPDIKDTGLS